MKALTGEERMTARTIFDQELNTLNRELTEMSEMVQNAIEGSFEALSRHDTRLAGRIIREDRNVDEMERQIERRCLSLMLRQQPVARDLRHISMALKVITDLERMGDQAADIAELTLHITDETLCGRVKHFPAMAESVKLMVRDAIHAFVERDSEAARGFEKRDDVVDLFFIKVKKEVAELLKTDGSQSDQAVELLMLAKYLERIGDHAVNVCEWTEFSDTGTIRQVPLL